MYSKFATPLALEDEAGIQMGSLREFRQAGGIARGTRSIGSVQRD